MLVTVRPGGAVGGEARVPGDKSIAHRWVILASTARGRSELRGLPAALDVRSTARVLAALLPTEAAAALEGWASQPLGAGEPDRSTTNKGEPRPGSVAIQTEGRVALHAPERPLDCANSGTTMRLVAGLLASRPFEATLVGDRSLSRRPMERVAEPLRAMGASVRTTMGHAPMTIGGGPLHGIGWSCALPSAQVKSAILLAGLAADGETSIREPAPTRDHTERALAALGAPIRASDGQVSVEPFQHGGFSGEVPADVSSAAFLVVAAGLTGAGLTLRDVGLNPSRTAYLAVLDRMGVRTRSGVEREELGEPVGTLEVSPATDLVGTTVTERELPLVIDEVPVLAMLAAHAGGETRFVGGAELRQKESDRLAGPAEAIRALGGDAALEGDELVVAGGTLRGGRASSAGDHRMAMALVVGGLGAAGPVTVEGAEAADVSFPGFVEVLRSLGARVET